MVEGARLESELAGQTATRVQIPASPPKNHSLEYFQGVLITCLFAKETLPCTI